MGTGTIALQGGGPFEANDGLDRRLLGDVGADRVVVLPTADAFEEPAQLIATAMSWGERLEILIEALMVLQRHDAEDEGAAEVVRAASAVYLVGDSAMHLRSVMRESAVWRAIEGVVAAGGLVVGVGSAATALGDPMLDQRGGALTLGLGLVRGLTVVPAAGDAQPRPPGAHPRAGRRAVGRAADRFSPRVPGRSLRAGRRRRGDPRGTAYASVISTVSRTTSSVGVSPSEPASARTPSRTSRPSVTCPNTT